jgi:hypothetical protein
MSGPRPLIDPRLDIVITELLTIFAEQATQHDIVLKERFDAAVVKFKTQLDEAIVEFWKGTDTLTVVVRDDEGFGTAHPVAPG